MRNLGVGLGEFESDPFNFLIKIYKKVLDEKYILSCIVNVVFTLRRIGSYFL
jgi:hypothetical protein